MFSTRWFECVNCGELFEVPYGEPKPEKCPGCDCTEIKRSLQGILFDNSVMEGYGPG